MSLFNLPKIISDLSKYNDQMKLINKDETILIDRLQQCDSSIKDFILEYWRFTQGINNRVYESSMMDHIPIMLDNVKIRNDIIQKLDITEQNKQGFCKRAVDFDFSLYTKMGSLN